jgi:hypothetical protein
MLNLEIKLMNRNLSEMVNFQNQDGPKTEPTTGPKTEPTQEAPLDVDGNQTDENGHTRR